ncbi:hypothetical protein Ahy_A02g005001 [Arachis hypogaea]|uniref:Uncharacterized protein n=1 Tax=Arachis hypogaea TaxID=3818 RepID=A0A445E5T6_ARAHY|nr:hypothetical protein Ahy_A02g005001 [Arachis hypogaea]
MVMTRIEEVIARLEDIAKHKDILGLEKIAAKNMSGRISSTSLVKKSDMFVGRDKERDTILAKCKRLKKLPSNMQNLVNMRHLDIEGTDLEEMPKKMSKLKDLQLLCKYMVGKQEENGGTMNLKQIR